jgi:hypothetical protein
VFPWGRPQGEVTDTRINAVRAEQLASVALLECCTGIARGTCLTPARGPIFAFFAILLLVRSNDV